MPGYSLRSRFNKDEDPSKPTTPNTVTDDSDTSRSARSQSRLVRAHPPSSLSNPETPLLPHKHTTITPYPPNSVKKIDLGTKKSRSPLIISAPIPMPPAHNANDSEVEKEKPAQALLDRYKRHTPRMTSPRMTSTMGEDMSSSPVTGGASPSDGGEGQRRKASQGSSKRALNNASVETRGQSTSAPGSREVSPKPQTAHDKDAVAAVGTVKKGIRFFEHSPQTEGRSGVTVPAGDVSELASASDDRAARALKQERMDSAATGMLSQGDARRTSAEGAASVEKHAGGEPDKTSHFSREAKYAASDPVDIPTPSRQPVRQISSKRTTAATDSVAKIASFDSFQFKKREKPARTRNEELRSSFADSSDSDDSDDMDDIAGASPHNTPPSVLLASTSKSPKQLKAERGKSVRGNGSSGSGKKASEGVDSSSSSDSGSDRSSPCPFDTNPSVPAALSAYPSSTTVLPPPSYKPTGGATDYWIWCDGRPDCSRPASPYGWTKRWSCCRCEGGTIVEQGVCASLECGHRRCRRGCRVGRGGEVEEDGGVF